MTKELAPYVKAIDVAKDRFVSLSGDEKTFQREALFAMQMLAKNDFSMSTANRNPGSVRMAMLNVASTGLTLNPANGYAYLVPRDGAIVLDISYKGLIKIATDAGSITWARADLVHEADEFTYHGPAMIPDHKANPFKDRGEVIGAYCIAKTNEGDILTEVMDMAELEKIRSKSQAYAKKKSGPWAEWFGEMARKTVIKRASKTWPYTDRSEAVAHAIEIANESEGGYDIGESEEEKAFKRQQIHDAALGRHFASVQFIKDALGAEEPDMYAVTEAWREIPEADQMALWLAPTKGGVFTTREREAIKRGVPRQVAIEQQNSEAA